MKHSFVRSAASFQPRCLRLEPVMTEEFEDMIEEVEDEVVEDSQSSADPINTEEVVEEDELIVTDEMLDTIADTAIAALQDILQYFNVGEVTIDEYEGDEGELILDISGKDMAVLIGRHGKLLTRCNSLCR